MNRKRVLWYVVIFVALLLIIGVYFFYDPTHNLLFPKCVFYSLTGYKCPGCGSQRAIYHLLHFNISGALKENLLLVLTIPLVLLLVYAEAVRTKKSDFYIKVHSLKLIVGYFVLVLLWGVFRNIFGL
ncbi:MAG: DUF2752 domain-containing protein [Bacteroidales bacterium]|nr:DUF2752 domain-containing protein [Bacteroidales bacterium]